MLYADVILPVPIEGYFTYSVPKSKEGEVRVGMRAVVPFGKTKTSTGIIALLHENKPDFEVKDLLELPDAQPMLLPQQLKLWQWISSYYLSPIGDVYKAAIPQGLKAEDGYRPKTETYVTLPAKMRNECSLHLALNILRRATKQLATFQTFLDISNWTSLSGKEPEEEIHEITREELMNTAGCSSAIIRQLIDRHFLEEYKKEVGRLNRGEASIQRVSNTLSPAQQEAFDGISRNFLDHNVVLLHGVTSSGKTEIYIHLINQALSQGKQVLYLLPEIALTVQITERLKRVFGSRLGIYHSKYSDAERVEIWKKQLSAEPYDIILGARSAVFLPQQRLGLVIIDEEHETSFKQQDPAPRYHARSAAIMLATMHKAKTLLGTATPSVESYQNAQTGKYGLVTLSERYKGIELPEVRVINVKDLRHRKLMKGPLSPPLVEAIGEALANHEQVILFQNRRGFAPMVECQDCGWTPKCTNCDVSLTYHKNFNTLTCHYCGYTYSVPTVCPSCGSHKLRAKGYGTEKIEDNIKELFPQARVSRMDLDTTHTRNAYERLIGDFSHQHTDILIGTQMVTKGLDFDHVRLVGILDADTMLNYPDFRSYEHAFTMMAQVSGRAGRKGKRGIVMLQTREPDMPIISQVVNNDYKTFFADTLMEREAFHYPPFYRLIYVYLKHSKEPIVDSAATEFTYRLRRWFGDRVLGPDKPAVARVKTLFIRKIMLKAENGLNNQLVRRYLQQEQAAMLAEKRYGAIQIYYDVDPM